MKKAQEIKYISPLSPKYHEEKVNLIQYFSKNARKKRLETRLQSSDSFQLIKVLATIMDTYMLDPILGIFLVPGIGDVICSACVLPFLYVSLFKVRSIALTLAILSKYLIDMCVGLIPFIGDIADFFIRSNRKSYTMIVGYAQNDPDIVSEVNSSAIFAGILCAIFGTLLYFMIKYIVLFWDWFYGWICSLI